MPAPLSENTNLVIGIGASAGGLGAIVEIVDLLPTSFQAALIVAVHRLPTARSQLPAMLQHHTRLHVSEPIDGDKLTCTHIYVARPDEVVTVDGTDLRLGVDRDHLRKLMRIDDLFLSIAESAGENAVGVILSGMLWDGVQGLGAIKEAGGTCLVQSPEDAAFDDMPRAALAAVDVDFVGTTFEIASRLMELAAGRKCG